MPGGSVNGRPFRETADAYSRTGIPCGNPKRYQSREVMKMGVQNQTAFSKPLTGPLEDIETEADRQLQTLLHNQLNTQITLKEHFNQHKRFSEAVSHQPTTDILSGTFTLDQYQKESQLDQYVMELKHCGLTQEEIQFKLEDLGMDTVKKKRLRLNLEPGIRDKIMATINDKISAKKKELEGSDHFSGARLMGRHEMDLEKSIAHNSNRTKFFNCLLTSSSPSNFPLRVSEDPMDHLPEILAQMSKGRKKAQSKQTDMQRKPQDDNIGNTGYDRYKSESTDTKCGSVASHGGQAVNQDNQILPENKLEITNWSVLSDNKPDVFSCSIGQNNDSDLACPVEKSSHLKDSDPCGEEEATPQIISSKMEQFPLRGEKSSHLKDQCRQDETTLRILSSKIQQIPLSDIIENRLSVEEIKAIPRFKDFHPGLTSKVLYVKNLPAKVREEDLVSLFIRFQINSPIVFRLLTGRMKGQAFITFNDEETATEALQLLNGYMFKGKPIIIQFGKKQD